MSSWRSKHNRVEIYVYSDEITESKVPFIIISDGRPNCVILRYFSKPVVLVENYIPLDRAALRDYIKWK